MGAGVGVLGVCSGGWEAQLGEQGGIELLCAVCLCSDTISHNHLHWTGVEKHASENGSELILDQWKCGKIIQRSLVNNRLILWVVSQLKENTSLLLCHTYIVVKPLMPFLLMLSPVVFFSIFLTLSLLTVFGFVLIVDKRKKSNLFSTCVWHKGW